MEIKFVDHFVITTSNLEKCLNFYVNILGMKHRTVDGQHVLEFGCEKINLHTYVGEFTPFARHAAMGAQDFCLISSGDIHAIKQELLDKGVTIVEGVIEQNGACGLMDSVYMYDPDGNLVEIAVYRPQN